MKKNYESYIIFDGNLEDNAIEELIVKYENLLKKNDVDLKNTERIGRRRLAYAIKKKLNGYYICFDFMANTDYIPKLERTYKLDESVIRYLTFSMDKKTIQEKDDYFRKKAAHAEKLEEERAEQNKEEPGKLLEENVEKNAEPGKDNEQILKN
jgi:small subunit ribosomal protein S6